MYRLPSLDAVDMFFAGGDDFYGWYVSAVADAATHS
jgi:hypothetical protein